MISLYKYKCNILQKSTVGYHFHIKTFVTDVSEKKKPRFLNPWERIYKLKRSTDDVEGIEDSASACRLPFVIELAYVTGQGLFKLHLHILVLPSFIKEKRI